ncbi:DUF2911 domain-containing protein [Mucilaginibacter sp. RS28]|uniref:DUF2911 domain-containing protein n=1 Tax=Mucilaginibacter straminoryzae TaxID=2932774 RepID=A0A9X1X5K7_9SPHI|nr:DUF2911 domain-containing protein [Mucilaginibacter straminoryzae]MCJ8211391.1 DUF2911 domain-containing protein [Mucilaginibacter straminoryzae]
MKIKQVSKVLFMAFAAMLMFVNCQAQPKSPLKTATGTVGKANITIVYSSPSARGRKIWGELVPYGKAWRAGANAATTFETDKEITIEGKKLPAGKYSLFITPTESEWTVIFNSQTGQSGIKEGGVANFDKANNVLTVTVKPERTDEMVESLTYSLNNKGLTISWEHLTTMLKIK